MKIQIEVFCVVARCMILRNVGWYRTKSLHGVNPEDHDLNPNNIVLTWSFLQPLQFPYLWSKKKWRDELIMHRLQWPKILLCISNAGIS